MAYINVTVDTPTKTYQGKLTLDDKASFEDVSNAVKAIASGINALEFMSIENNGTAIVFSKEMLAKSVVSLTPTE